MSKPVSSQFKDLYFETDLELLPPDRAHDVEVNEYTQERNKLTYKYRRIVAPVAICIKALDRIRLPLSKGKYRVNLKGIYGEDYTTLKDASNSLEVVKVSKTKHGYIITKNRNSSGYIVLPTAYDQGMKTTSGDQSLKVEQVNGAVTGTKAPKNITEIQLSYTPPYYHLPIAITIFSIIYGIILTRWVEQR